MPNPNNHGGRRANQTGRPKLGKTKTLVTHYPSQEVKIRKFI